MAGKPRQAEETAVKNESLPSRQTKEKKTMDIRKFKELIAKREKIHPEDYLTIEHCDKELIDVLCEDMPGTIKYLYSECTVEEFLWLSEF